MRGWTSIAVGFLLLALAVWTYSFDGFGSLTLFCGVAAVFLFVRGAQGVSVGDSGDPTALIEFVTNPADAIVDSATDRFTDWMQGDKATPQASTVAEQPGFDADAAIARYLAQRETEPADAPASPAPHRGFGRKGL